MCVVLGEVDAEVKAPDGDGGNGRCSSGLQKKQVFGTPLVLFYDVFLLSFSCKTFVLKYPICCTDDILELSLSVAVARLWVLPAQGHMCPCRGQGWGNKEHHVLVCGSKLIFVQQATGICGQEVWTWFAVCMFGDTCAALRESWRQPSEVVPLQALSMEKVGNAPSQTGEPKWNCVDSEGNALRWACDLPRSR